MGRSKKGDSALLRLVMASADDANSALQPDEGADSVELAPVNLRLAPPPSSRDRKSASTKKPASKTPVTARGSVRRIEPRIPQELAELAKAFDFTEVVSRIATGDLDGLSESLGPPTLNELLKEVPKDRRHVFLRLIALIDELCLDRFEDEFRDLCRTMAAELCKEDSLLDRGKLDGWACGIVYAIGWVNFPTHPHLCPDVCAQDIPAPLGISETTMRNRFRELRDSFDLEMDDPCWSLPAVLNENLMVLQVLAEAALPAGS